MLLARGMVGDSDLKAGGVDLRDDCSGLVIGCFTAAGVPLVAPEAQGRSGTELIYESLRARGRVFTEGRPRPGDVIFFDDTWDSDGDGLRGDRFTHVGLVERVRPDGVVQFLHYLSGAVRRGRLDPSRPDLHLDPATGEVVNDWLRRRAVPGETRLLAGELFVAYGRP